MSNLPSQCFCWNNTDNALREKGYRIASACSAFGFNEKGLIERHYLPIERVDGRRKRSSDPTGVAISYCPFCGASIAEAVQPVTPNP